MGINGRKIIIGIPILLLFGALTAAPEFDPKNVALEIHRAIRSVPWDSPPPDNKEEFRGDFDAMATGESWMYRASVREEPFSQEYYFYPLESDPPKNQLEKMTISVSGQPLAALEKVHEELSRQLSLTYGRPDLDIQKEDFRGLDTARIWPSVGDHYRGKWRKLQRWNLDRRQIFLYISESARYPASLRLIVRHDHLVKAREKFGRITALAAAEEREYSRDLQQRLQAELAGPHPDLPASMAEIGGFGRIRSKLSPETLTLLFRMNKDLPRIEPARQPALMLAVDWLAGSLYLREDDPEGVELQKKMKQEGLNFVIDHLGACWVYDRQLLLRAWEEFGGTDWGEEAFLLLLRRGFNLAPGCKTADLFREVILRGEEFLKTHTKTKLRVNILFLLAEAYETWWSLSRCLLDYYEPLISVYGLAYTEGAEDARQKAVKIYSEIRSLAPQSAAAGFASIRLPILKLRGDPYQRRYYCIYD